MTEQRAQVYVKLKSGEIAGYPTEIQVKPDGTWLALEECDPGPSLQVVRLESCEAMGLRKEGSG